MVAVIIIFFITDVGLFTHSQEDFFIRPDENDFVFEHAGNRTFGLSAGRITPLFTAQVRFLSSILSENAAGICGGLVSREKIDEVLGAGFGFVNIARALLNEPALVKEIGRLENR